jgi:hypothetical protein
MVFYSCLMRFLYLHHFSPISQQSSFSQDPSHTPNLRFLPAHPTMSGFPSRVPETSESTKDQASDINLPKQDNASTRDATVAREESVASSHTAGRWATLTTSSEASSHTAGRSATPSSETSSHTAGRSATPPSIASSRTAGRSPLPVMSSAGGPVDTGSARGGWKVAGSEEEDDEESEDGDGDEGDVFARAYMDGSG